MNNAAIETITETTTETIVADGLDHNHRILVVEDDITTEPLWLGIVKRASRHASVDWATSEAEAESLILRAKAAGHQYSLVITDIFLSGSRTGIDLWQRFYQEMRGRIIMTSVIDYAKFNRYFEKEVIKPVFLKKPLVPHECIEIVFQILNRRIYD